MSSKKGKKEKEKDKEEGKEKEKEEACDKADMQSILKALAEVSKANVEMQRQMLDFMKGAQQVENKAESSSSSKSGKEEAGGFISLR